MLLSITFKRIVDFHGHLCPDLVIGCRFCEYAQNLLEPLGELKSGISVIAENSTSALDAVQIMLGTTVGNQRLQILDYGKHSYTLITQKGKSGFRLTMKKQQFNDEESFSDMDHDMRSRPDHWQNALWFQKMLDQRVKHFLNLQHEDLFDVTPIDTQCSLKEFPSVYLTCSVCGEQVLKSRHIFFREQIYCSRCFHHQHGEKTRFRMQ